jgi:hypothetical protein
MVMDVDEDIDVEAVDNLDYDLEENTATFDLEEFKAMGINPFKATHARPGSEEKVLMLSARYAAGLPLWHDSDCYDHGPHETELMGALGGIVPQFAVATEGGGDDDEVEVEEE